MADFLHFDVSFAVSPNRLLDKQSSCRRFQTQWHSCDVTAMYFIRVTFSVHHRWWRLCQRTVAMAGVFAALKPRTAFRTRLRWLRHQRSLGACCSALRLVKHVRKSRMTSWPVNVFRITDPLWGGLAGHEWFPSHKVCNVELWWFLCC